MNILGQHIHATIIFLALLEFCFAGFSFLLSGYLLLSSEGLATVAEGQLIPWTLTFSTAVVIGLTAMGLYQVRQRLRLEGVLVRVVVGVGVAMILLAVLDFLMPLGMGRLLWGWSFVITLALLCAGRIVWWRFVDHEVFRRCVLVYGAGERAANLLKLRRRSDQRGFRITAFVPAPGDKLQLEDPRVTVPHGSLLRYSLENNVNEIIIAMDDRRRGFPVQDLLNCKFAGIAILDLVGFLERETGKLKVDLANPSWLIFSNGFPVNNARVIASRALDFVVLALLFVPALFIMLFVAAAILMEDGRPIFYRQERVGLRGQTFTLFKFRSMVENAEADGKAVWAHKSDPRVTRVGATLRKLRLDELPQLFNVLRGEMSFVGPRPERPEFVESLARKIPYYHERHSVKPGITGWAQLSYPYGSSEHDAMEKLQYDLYYVKHRSLIFDLMVLLQTAEVVLWGKGAR